MKLNKEEKAILEAFEKGNYKTVENFEEKKKVAMQAAKNTLKQIKKDTRITIRINQQDLNLIKTKAIHEGLPYQTLIGSLLHKYAQK